MDESNSQHSRRVVVSIGAMAVLRKELERAEANKDSAELTMLPPQTTGEISKDSFSRKHIVAAHVAAHEKCKKSLKKLALEKPAQHALVVTIGVDRVVPEPSEAPVAEEDPAENCALANLKEIFLPQLELNKCHRGRVLFGRLCVSPFQISSIMTVLADKSGKAVRVCISSGHSLLSKEELDARFGMDLRVGIKEPHLKLCSDHLVAIKVDNPSHFVLVDDLKKEISTDLDAAIEGLDKIRAEGNALFNEQKWDEALQQYTDCIDRCSNVYKGPQQEDEKIRQCFLLAYSNRSEAWLQVGNFKNALDDANMALEFDPSHHKSISRRDRAWQSIGMVQLSTSRGKFSEDEPRKCLVGEPKEAAGGGEVQEGAQEVADGRKLKSSKGLSRTSKGTTHGRRSSQKNIGMGAAATRGGSHADESDSKNAALGGKSHRRKSMSPVPTERKTSSKSESPSKVKGRISKDTSLVPAGALSEAKGSRGTSTSPMRVQSGRGSARSSARSSRSVTPSKTAEGTDVTDSDSIESSDSDLSDERKRSRQNSRSPSRRQTPPKTHSVPENDNHVATSSLIDPKSNEFVKGVAQNGTSKISSSSKVEFLEVKPEASFKGKQKGNSKRKGGSNNTHSGGAQALIPQSKDASSTEALRLNPITTEGNISRPTSSDGKGTGKRGQSTDVDALGNAGFRSQSLDPATVGMAKPVNANRDAPVSRSDSTPRVSDETAESRKINSLPQQSKGKHGVGDEKAARGLHPQASKSRPVGSDSNNVGSLQNSVDSHKEPIAIVDQEGPLFATWLDSIRSSGDMLLNEGKWADAVAKYNKVLKVTVPKRNRDRVIQTILQAVSHRAEAWIWLGDYGNALRDVEFALQFMEKYPRSFADYEPEYLLNEVRKGRAFYGLHKYDQACTIFAAALQASPFEKSISDLLEKSRSCLEQSQNGRYHLDKYFLSACDGPPPPCCDYVGPIEIRSTPGKGRGLFLNADVSAGDLLLVSNPLAVVRRRLSRPGEGAGRADGEDDSHLLTAKWRRNVSAFGLDEFIGRLALSQSARKSYQFYSMAAGGAGDEAEVPDITAFIAGSEFEVPKDWTAPTTNAEDLRAIVRWNAIDGGLNPLCGINSRSQEREEIGCVGLWALPSFINHSCVPNCHMIDVGNAMFVRASCNMREGEELTRAYFDVFQDGINRQRTTKDEWDFICKCERCSLEKSLTIQRVLPLHEYRNLLESVKEESRRRIESEEKDRALSLLLPNPNPAHLQLRKFVEEFDRILFTADGLTCKEKAWIGASYLEAYVSRFVGNKDRNQQVLALENILDFMTNTAILGPGEARTTLARASFLLQEVIRYYGAGSYTHRRIEVRVLGLYAIAYGNLGTEILLTISHTMASSGKAFRGLIDDHRRLEARSLSHPFTQGNSDSGRLALQYY